MLLFTCAACGNALHFENRTCLSCARRLGFAPDICRLIALEPTGQLTPDNIGLWQDAGRPAHRYRLCANSAHDVCNWLIPDVAGPGADEPGADRNEYCRSCRHNRLIPGAGSEHSVSLWRRLEAAKHYLFYAILRWNLPDDGLIFDFVIDAPGQLTGHANGVITLRIAEADNVERERARTAMGEPYRTLIGHFRHESGHFFWDRLVAQSAALAPFRALFGDERQNYAQALERHYASGPPEDWNERFITAYAAAHPWEDWAESWAHYLHIVDSLETASAFGLSLGTAPLAAAVTFDPYAAAEIGPILSAWIPVTVALNSIQRSMGQPELYPFVITAPVVRKLSFIHGLVHGARRT